MNTYVEIRKLGSVVHSSGHNYYTNKEIKQGNHMLIFFSNSWYGTSDIQIKSVE